MELNLLIEIVFEALKRQQWKQYDASYTLLVRSSVHSKVSNPLRTLLAALKILKFRKWSLQSNASLIIILIATQTIKFTFQHFFPRACPLGYFSLFISRSLCYCILWVWKWEGGRVGWQMCSVFIKLFLFFIRNRQFRRLMRIMLTIFLWNF